MKKRTIYLASLALLLVMSASMGGVWAYFTTNASAQGGYTLELGNSVDIDEDFESYAKHVTITNSAESQPVYVRVKAFSGSEYPLVYSDAAGKWTPGADGYYYYSDIVKGGESAGVLDIGISFPEKTEITEETRFDVVVIYESTPVLYQADGSAYADWSITLDSGNAEGGAQ